MIKFVDDLSIAVKVDLLNDLESDDGRPQPHSFEERFKTKKST